MAQHYTDPRRESDPHALSDVETWYVTPREALKPDTMTPEKGWYYWYCLPGCLPDSEPNGPFDTEEEALSDARSWNDESSDDDPDEPYYGN